MMRAMIAQKSSEQGYRPSENRYGHDNDVQVSKRRRTNKKLAKPRFLSG